MFNISSDPNEHFDLAEDPANAALLKEMINMQVKKRCDVALCFILILISTARRTTNVHSPTTTLQHHSPLWCR
jgi:hypothetical protein